MYYGTPITDEKAIQGIQAAVMGNFGATTGAQPEAVREFEKALRKAGKKVDFKIYPGAPHAFANVNNPWAAIARTRRRTPGSGRSPSSWPSCGTDRPEALVSEEFLVG